MMKQKLMGGMRLLTGNRGVALIALAFLGMVSMMPGWVSAQSDTTSTFTSPLPGADDEHHSDHGGDHHGGSNDEIRELLDTLIDREEILADVLGITVEELAAAREEGVSIHELIDQAGLDEETVHTEIQNAITEAVQQAVTDGTITQEQADAILNPPTPPQPGNGHGHDGHHQQPDPGDDPEEGETPTPAADVTPEATPEATTAAAGAPLDNTAVDGPEHHRPHREQGPAAQNDDTTTDDATGSSASSSDATTSDTTSNNDEEPAVNEDQPPGEPHNQPDGNHRPRR